jgi:hypothetical protein
MAETNTVEAKRIQMNTAQQTLEAAKSSFDQTRTAYITSLQPEERSRMLLKEIEPVAERLDKEAKELAYINTFIMKQMGQGLGSSDTLASLNDMANDEIGTVKKEIDELKSQIRLERRRFLDAGPNVSPAVAGLYYTKVPDNQVLIALLSVTAILLAIVSALIIMNHLPFAYFQAMTMSERVKITGVIWVAGIIAVLVGLWTFT